MSVAVPLRNFSVEGGNLGRDFVFEDANQTYRDEDNNIVDKGEGSLANSLKPQTPQQGMINVVKGYDWTTSPIKNRDDALEEVPYIRLIEYRCNETMIKRQIGFYSKLTPDLFGQTATKTEVLEVYKEIFPKDDPTNFSYWFPYFNKTGFQLSTQEWQQLDSIGESLKQIAGGASDLASRFGNVGKQIAGGIDILAKGAEFAVAGAQTALAWQYPSVGVVDRPRVFSGHTNRQMVISFPLFNTINENAWAKNRDLIYLLMSQNLFNKRDYITGVPPVFYDVYVPGQYYCYAAAMTDINVEYLGNSRMLYGEYIVPDAYQVTLTLSELVSPSKNQFEAVVNGAAKKFVNSETIAAEQAAQQTTSNLPTNVVPPTLAGVRLPPIS